MDRFCVRPRQRRCAPTQTSADVIVVVQVVVAVVLEVTSLRITSLVLLQICGPSHKLG